MFISKLFKNHSNVYDKYANNKTLLYKGAYHHGYATYEYVDFKYFRVFNGMFNYKNTYDTLTKTKGKEVVTGNYSNDKKSNHWEYICSERNVKMDLKIEYTRGIQSGLYEYRRKGDYYGFDGRNYNTYIHAIMRNGHLTGTIKAFIDNSLIVGECDSHGYPNGTWYMDMVSDNKHIKYYEVWDHGLMVDYYCIDTTTGNRYDKKIDILVKIKCFIKYECYPIESIIKKGSIRWHGDIMTKVDENSS